jgi:hypothetical protein
MGNTGRVPAPGPGSARITPALVNLVCTGARLNYAAYAGTILDLAGRGYFDVSEPRPGRLVLQVPGTAQPGGELTSYERLALERTARLAGRAGAPFEVLAGAAGTDTPGIWDPFAAEVRSSAKHAGLTRQVPLAPALPWIIAGFIAVFLIAAQAMHAPQSGTPAYVLGAVFAVLVLLLIIVLNRRRERLSSAGKALAARYHGGGTGPGPAPQVRLQVTSSDLSGSAYAVAAGRSVPIHGVKLAEVSGMRKRTIWPVTRLLGPRDLQAERPRQAWSSYNGRWRIVPIGGDPRRPSAGDFVPLFWAMLIGYIAFGVNQFGMPAGIRALVTVGLLALCAVLLLQTVKALRPWPAYWAEREITGQVIARWEQHYVTDTGTDTLRYLAVDDGRRAWPLRNLAGDDGTIRPGDQVRVRVVRSTSTLVSHAPAVPGAT